MIYSQLWANKADIYIVLPKLRLPDKEMLPPVKVLTVSSSNSAWKKINEWIKELGAEPIRESFCKEGMNRINSDPEIDLVIVETTSASDCGVSFLQTIRRDLRLKHLPIIMAGEDFEDDKVAKFLELKVNDILVIPTVRQTFEAKLRKAIANGKKAVLVVDDEPTILDVLEHFLTLERYRALKAGTAEDAIEMLKEEKIDVVVTDVMLPGQSGADLLKHVKENYPTLPVIMITGHSGSHTTKEFMAMGADGYFTKPFNNQELIYTLRNCLTRTNLQTTTPSQVKA